MYSFAFTNLMVFNKGKISAYLAGEGIDFIFFVRENYCDFTFLNRFIEQDFVDNYKLMVVGQRINQQKNTIEYYIKSQKSKIIKK